MPGGVAAAFGVGRFRKSFATGVESFQVRGGVRTRRAPDGRLIHNHHLTDVRIALEAVAKFLNAPANALGRHRFVQNVVHQRGFAGPTYAGHHRERAKRNHDIEVLQVVQTGAEKTQELARRFVTFVRDGNEQFAVEIAASERFGLLEKRSVRAGKKQLASKLPRAGTQVNDVRSEERRVGKEGRSRWWPDH